MTRELPGTGLIRLIDVFVLGPAMMIAARKAQDLSPRHRQFLHLAGLGTILFNGLNLLRKV